LVFKTLTVPQRFNCTKIPKVWVNLPLVFSRSLRFRVTITSFLRQIAYPNQNGREKQRF
jgi:hypothetical protein